MNKDAEKVIVKLSLLKHPEGGYFKEIYRADEIIDQFSLPERYSGTRCFATSIYFLLHDDQCSKLHRIRSDEMWHHYSGSSLRIYSIDSNGELKTFMLGRNIDENELPQVIVSHGSWFGAELCAKDSYALIGCTVSPGFEFSDFELGRRDYLLETYPQHTEIIYRLT